MAAPKSSELVEIIGSFNSTLKRLTVSLAECFPGDATIDRAKKRIMLAISANPTHIIREVGPYLYKYKDEIAKGDENFFLANDYDAEMKEGDVNIKDGLVVYIIPKVKESYATSDPAKKQRYLETVQNLLDDYVEYLFLTC